MNEFMSRFEGPVNSIPTAFLADGEIDWEAIRKMIDLGIEAGGSVALTTAGNSQLMYLSLEEIEKLARVLVEHVAGRAITVMATPLCGTRVAVQLARLYKEIGADIILATPYGSSGLAAEAEGLIDFYRSTAEVMPTMLVGYPHETALDGLLDVPNIVAFKEDGAIEYAIQTTARYGARWKMMSGGQLSRHYSQWPYGCRAFFASFMSFNTEIDMRYWKALLRNDHATALRVLKTIDLPFFKKGCAYPGGFQPFWRAALKVCGVARSQRLRSPMTSLSDEQVEQVRRDLNELGLL